MQDEYHMNANAMKNMFFKKIYETKPNCSCRTAGFLSRFIRGVPPLLTFFAFKNVIRLLGLGFRLYTAPSALRNTYGT